MTPRPIPTRGPLIWLLLLFIGSGCAALIYEIVWLQLLQLVIGSSAVSLGVLLGTFMGGMGLGSFLLPRCISPHAHPLRVYGWIELSLGLIGLLVLAGLPKMVPLYTTWAGHGFSTVLLRGVVCAVCLLPPTILMGTTLPAMARFVESTPRGIGWLGFFYGGNIAGAVMGCLLAGFYLLRVHDMPTATYVAAVINGSVAMMAFALAKQLGPRQTRAAVLAVESAELPRVFEAPCAGSGDSACRTEGENIADLRTTGASPGSAVLSPSAGEVVYLVIGLSGLCAMGAEVIWTRLLSLLLGGTVYAFSIILAVFLAGLGVGSSAGAALARVTCRPGQWLAVCQLLLTVAMAWSAVMLGRSLPYWPINPSLSHNPWFDFQLDLIRCLWTVFPAACLWGASFPLALAAVASSQQDLGRVTGGVSAANTAGAIVGSLGASLLLIGWVGTQHAQQVLILLAGLAAFLMLAFPGGTPSVQPEEAVKNNRPAGKGARSTSAALRLAVVVGLAAAMAWLVPPVPWKLIAYGRFVPNWYGKASLLYVGEGLNSSVAVSEMKDGVRNFHVSGKVEASTGADDMRLQRMLGHLPALLHPKPRSVLIVGCGAGVTAGTFVTHPDVERIVICEIEPLIPRVISHYFAWENHDVMSDRRVKVVYDDARHFILTTHEKFDIITSDPIHPWVKGAATLYTREYFQLCRQHLNPGGIVTQWVPLYESTLAAVKSEIGTFFEAFPYGTLWGNESVGEGYDLVVLGQTEASPIRVDSLQERLDRKEHFPETLSLLDVGFRSAVDLLGTYAGRAEDLRDWLKDAQINQDRNLRLQYLAGLGLNENQSAQIYEEILTHRRFSKDLFVASDRREDELRRKMGFTKEPARTVPSRR